MIRFARLFFSLTLLVSLAAHAQQEAHLPARTVDSLFNQGYLALRTGPAEALPYFQEIVRSDSFNLVALKQLGFIMIALERPEDALSCFRACQRIAPSDTTEMQIAYLLAGLGRNSEASESFRSLTGSLNPRFREEARSASTVLALMKCEEAYPWWLNLSAAPYYDSRFKDLIFSFAATGGWYTGRDRVLSLYGTAALTRDTRSKGGALPVIYSDNYALLGAGIRLSVLRGLSAIVQEGVTEDLVERPGQTKTNADFRAVASFGTGLYPVIQTPDDWHWRATPLAEIYTSLGYYSRYTNTIGYAMGRLGIRLGECGRSALDVYLRGDFVADTKNEFYNNVAELSFGMRFIPDHLWGLSLSLEYHRGVYWRSSGSVNPYGHTYDDVRVFLLFDKWVCW